MNQTETFFASLREWREIAEIEADDYNDSLLFVIGYNLGVQDTDFTLNKEDRENMILQRVNDLVENHDIKEDFLITSLVRMVDEHLDRNFSNLGSVIANLLEAKERGISKANELLEKVTSPGYVIKRQRELENWRIIAIKNLGDSSRRYWDIDRMPGLE